MSAVEIMAELPKLTDEERSAVRRRLRDMDKQKAENARRKAR